MAKKKETDGCCAPVCGTGCRVESILSVDERGQMVLPKDVRDRAGIGPGDKLALVTLEKDGKICCLSLLKADDMVGMVKDLLGPMMQAVIGG